MGINYIYTGVQLLYHPPLELFMFKNWNNKGYSTITTISSAIPTPHPPQVPDN